MQAKTTNSAPPAIWKLKNQRFVAGHAAELFDNDFSAMDAWPQFQNFWNDLELDRYMNDGGMYDGWTDHSVIVTPDLASGFDLKVTGQDRNDIKDFIGEMFAELLNRDITDQEFAKACGVTKAA